MASKSKRNRRAQVVLTRADIDEISSRTEVAVGKVLLRVQTGGWDEFVIDQLKPIFAYLRDKKGLTDLDTPKLKPEMVNLLRSRLSLNVEPALVWEPYAKPVVVVPIPVEKSKDVKERKQTIINVNVNPTISVTTNKDTKSTLKETPKKTSDVDLEKLVQLLATVTTESKSNSLSTDGLSEVPPSKPERTTENKDEPKMEQPVVRVPPSERKHYDISALAILYYEIYRELVIGKKRWTFLNTSKAALRDLNSKLALTDQQSFAVINNNLFNRLETCTWAPLNYNDSNLRLLDTGLTPNGKVILRQFLEGELTKLDDVQPPTPEKKYIEISDLSIRYYDRYRELALGKKSWSLLSQTREALREYTDKLSGKDAQSYNAINCLVSALPNADATDGKVAHLNLKRLDSELSQDGKTSLRQFLETELAKIGSM